MIETTAKTERELRRRAFAEATDLFAADGPSAIPAVSKRAKDIAKSDDDRRYDRLTLLELERLARLQTRQQTSHALGLWAPPAFSFEGLQWFSVSRGDRLERRPWCRSEPIVEARSALGRVATNLG